jgi:cell fate (sporulation/competence/biofilm development) regulator YlbF (YheA/YmcA/DUF963 family)
MNDVKFYTDNLLEAINNSEEYLNYKKALERLKLEGDLINHVNEFRRRRFMFQTSSSEDTFENNQRLDTEYDWLLQNPVVMEFLNAEFGYYRMLRHIKSKMRKKIDLDLMFLDE